MLWDIDRDREINHIPHSDSWRILESRLATADMLAIKDRLNEMIDAREIHTTSWMPGSDWSGTPFQPIFEDAAHGNFDLARKFFGLIVWVVFMERPEKWAFGRYEKDGVPIEGLTYFQIL